MAEDTALDAVHITVETEDWLDTGASVGGVCAYCPAGSGEAVFTCPVTLTAAQPVAGTRLPQKSIAVAADGCVFDYPLFPGSDFAAYRSFELSNGGQDGIFTRIADALQTGLLADAMPGRLLVPASKPVVVYINGEYYGQYMLREAMDEWTICRHEGLGEDRADEIRIVRGRGNVLQQKKDTGWDGVVARIGASNPGANQKDRAMLEEAIDVSSFVDWLAAKVFFGDADPTSVVFYQLPGGKWKCAAWDFSLGLYTAAFDAANMYITGENELASRFDQIVFRKILEIDQYRDLFLTRLAELRQKATVETMQAKLDACVAGIEPEMMKHFRRWAPLHDQTFVPEWPVDPVQAYDFWQARILRMRDKTIPARPGYVLEQVQAAFDLDEKEMQRYFGAER